MRVATAFAFLSVFAVASAEVIDGLVKRGQSSETCGCISGSLNLSTSHTGVSNFKLEEVCLCESQVSSFVDSHSTCQKASKLVGKTKVVEVITTMIQKSSTKSKCTFPGNHTPSCSKDNLCNFSCTSGFTKENKNGEWSCVCKAPASICNNKCSLACPSARSLPEKRDLLYWGKLTQRTCKLGWQACGVYGGGPRDWECVDVQNDLESCGGCPMDISSSLTGKPLGVDCTILPGVADVSCVSGLCAVSKCMPGYKVSRSGQHCEEDREDKGMLDEAIRVAEVAALGIPFSH